MAKRTLYKRMYLGLLNDVTVVIAELDAAITEFKEIEGDLKNDLLELQIKAAIKSLQAAQQRMEQMYIDV